MWARRVVVAEEFNTQVVRAGSSPFADLFAGMRSADHSGESDALLFRMGTPL